jgi:ABC-type antimicrobial peptide transport system permease subunit
VLASLATRLLSSVVFGVSPRDPAVIATVAATMIAVGAISCWAPARRALRVQPIAALKGE